MPWNTMDVRDQRLMFVGDVLRDQDSFAGLCRRYGISRKTGYKWVDRYRQQGLEGLQDRSSKPDGHPCRVPFSLRQEIADLRTHGQLTLGAKKIQVKLRELHPDIDPPAVSTINKILSQAGLSRSKVKRRRYDRYRQPLSETAAPHELWSVDFKGQFKLAGGQWCYPLTVMDDHSRYLVGIRGQESVEHRATRANFRRLFQAHGLPQRIRSDNGTPFSSNSTAGLSQLSIWWIRLGIHPERIEPGKPQQNGRHERMHRTFKDAVLSKPCGSMKAQQRSFERFRQDYNADRPHESLDMQTPASRYDKSPRDYPAKLPPIDYPSYFQVKKVSPSGVIYQRRGQSYISHLLSGEYIGLDVIDDGIYDVYFSFYRLGRLDTTLPTEGGRLYWSIKV